MSERLDTLQRRLGEALRFVDQRGIQQRREMLAEHVLDLVLESLDGASLDENSRGSTRG